MHQICRKMSRLLVCVSVLNQAKEIRQEKSVNMRNIS